MDSTKVAMSMLEIEAYALSSSSFIPNDSHCYVVSGDESRTYCWTNCGRGWNKDHPGTKVAQTRAYKEWLLEFVPCNDIDKCGLTFCKNGVCHTYANRELLLGEDQADARLAPKDYVCVVFFGKYGFGLKQLKQLLTDSFNRVAASYDISRSVLDTVLQRVDDTVDDELRAWRQTGIEYAHIPIDEILAKSPQAGLAIARSRMRDFIEKREKIYEECAPQGSNVVHQKVKQLIQTESDDYLNMLASIGYISEADRQTYSQNIADFLSRVRSALRAQETYFLRTGCMMEDFRELQETDE